MRELGMKQVVVWLDAREWGVINDAASADFKKLATWIRTAAYHAAEEAGKKRRNKSN